MNGPLDPNDPLSKTEFVTIDQLNKHYSLFVNRVQEQLSTLGGGGETRLQYLDDVVGIATNANLYDGMYLRYDRVIKSLYSLRLAHLHLTQQIMLSLLAFQRLLPLLERNPCLYAGIATEATTAGYATNSGIATYASTVGIATFANDADIQGEKSILYVAKRTAMIPTLVN